jgi:hypothetical protein
MTLMLGTHCVFDRILESDPQRLARLVALITDPRWLYRFKLIDVWHTPERPPVPVFKGTVPAAKLQQSVNEAVTSPSAEHVLFGVSRTRQSVVDSARFGVDLGRPLSMETALPFELRSIWHVPADHMEAAARAWLELQHDIVALVEGLNAVIIATTSSDIVGIETSLVDRWVDGRSVHPDPDEIGAYAARRRKLGHEYVRAPRWGTYLKPAHVAAIGGRDRIVTVVKPPLVREVGDLLYVQLSERVSDALAPETEARRRAFADLLAPITLPRLET